VHGMTTMSAVESIVAEIIGFGPEQPVVQFILRDLKTITANCAAKELYASLLPRVPSKISRGG
jgi:hypothetical protein